MSSNDTRLRPYRSDHKHGLIKFVDGVNFESEQHDFLVHTDQYMLCAAENGTVLSWDLQNTEASAPISDLNNENSSFDQSRPAQVADEDEKANVPPKNYSAVIHEFSTLQERPWTLQVSLRFLSQVIPHFFMLLILVWRRTELLL